MNDIWPEASKMKPYRQWPSRFLFLVLLGMTGALSTASMEAVAQDNFTVPVYTSTVPPPTPALADLPLMTEITREGITWIFARPQRVGRFVNGD